MAHLGYIHLLCQKKTKQNKTKHASNVKPPNDWLQGTVCITQKDPQLLCLLSDPCSPEALLTSTICLSSFYLTYCFYRSWFPHCTLRINIPVRLQDFRSNTSTVNGLFPAHDRLCVMDVFSGFCIWHMLKKSCPISIEMQSVWKLQWYLERRVCTQRDFKWVIIFSLNSLYQANQQTNDIEMWRRWVLLLCACYEFWLCVIL